MIAPFPSVVASTDGVAGDWVDVSDVFGAHATTCGVRDADATDAADVPVVFVAVVVKVYAVPLVRPVTEHDPDVPVTVQVFVVPETCGDAETVNDVGGPPSPEVTVTVTCPSPATAVGCGGVPGAASVMVKVTSMKLARYVLVAAAFARAVQEPTEA